MEEIEVGFPSGELVLEGVLGVPGGQGPFPAVVMCHPYPLYGGTMDYWVVTGVCEALVRNRLVAFRFNFRGVGRSQGRHSGGPGEAADVTAAIDYICARPEVDAGMFGLAGCSAGAGYSVLAGVNDARVKAWAAVSPPLNMFDFGALKGCRKPKFLISGDRDSYTPKRQFVSFCRELPEPKECQVIKGADHFWAGREEVLVEEVAAFFARELGK
jgi:alpha/beta superfamily hydrolase